MVVTSQIHSIYRKYVAIHMQDTTGEQKHRNDPSAPLHEAHCRMPALRGSILALRNAHSLQKTPSAPNYVCKSTALAA